ncbi:MAG TPA: hypothetical protein VFJ12_14100 [Segeticoccus sp.]|nr:hypothetical protein [Segeticoccus sp.]
MSPTTMSIRQLICALADTESEMRRSLRSARGVAPVGNAELADVLARQRVLVAELRRRRTGRRDGAGREVA